MLRAAREPLVGRGRSGALHAVPGDSNGVAGGGRPSTGSGLGRVTDGSRAATAAVRSLVARRARAPRRSVRLWRACATPCAAANSCFLVRITAGAAADRCYDPLRFRRVSSRASRRRFVGDQVESSHIDYC